MHLVAYLNNRVSDTEIEAAANSAGVVVRAVSRFYEAAPSRSGLMLGFSLQWPRPGLPKELLPSAIMVALTGRISRHQMPPGKGPLTALCSWSMATRRQGVHVPKMAFAWAPFWPRPRVKSDLRRIDAYALGPCVRESRRRAELLAVPPTT